MRRDFGPGAGRHLPRREVYRKLQSLKADAQQSEIEEVGNPKSRGFSGESIGSW